MNIETIDHQKVADALKYPAGKIRVVIDTDAYNEVDDQFAIAWALRSTDRMDVEAVYAAPYCSKALQKISPVSDEFLKSFFQLHFTNDPAEGMEKSYQEIRKIFGLMNQEPQGRVFRGSDRFLGNDGKPVESEAARDLVNRAMKGEGPLYVLAIGAITNVVSAILMEPKILEKIVVVWLGGQPLHFKSAMEFNLIEDMKASQLLFESGVPLVLIPCMTVASHLTVTREELDKRLIGKSKIGNYLGESVIEHFQDTSIAQSDRFLKGAYLRGMDDVPDEIANAFTVKDISWSRIIWDISTVGYIVNPNWCSSTLTPAPVLLDEMTWQHKNGRHPIRVCHYVSRDHIFGDMFAKLEKA
jgi:inosine-uridine nucleoside N-ribohydrolase